MTNEELTRVRRLNLQIEKQEKYLLGLRQLTMTMETIYSDMPRAHTPGKKVEHLTIKIIAAEEKLADLRKDLVQAREALTEQILDEFDEPTLQRILLLRYVRCYSWTQVSRALPMDRTWVYREHKQFLATLPRTTEH